MKHGDLYKLMVHWDGGCGERIPAWANRVVQDEQTKIFSAQVWSPEYRNGKKPQRNWKHDSRNFHNRDVPGLP